MFLDDEQAAQVIQKLDDLWPEPRECPACGKRDWTLANQIFELSGFDPGGVIHGVPVFPVIALTCNHCGKAHFFSAITMGLVPREPTEEKDAGAKADHHDKQ